MLERVQVGTFTMAQMGQSKSVIGEFMKQKRKVCPLATRGLQGDAPVTGVAVFQHARMLVPGIQPHCAWAAG
jgi:hypothetical protein